MPAVSILLPVRNGGQWLHDAVVSIQAQTFSDWELLLVDDHSTDDAVCSLPADHRLRILPAKGTGIVAALNQGLAAARAPLLARMDADDLMAPERLARQVSALHQHPDVDLCATAVTPFPAKAFGTGMREYLRWQHSCTHHQSITANMFRESPFVHPSVMVRTAALRRLGGYRTGNFPEDYDLWLRMHAAGDRFLRLPEPLLHWRQHPHSLSRTDPRCHRRAIDHLRARHLSRHLQTRVDPQRPLVFAGAGPRTRRRARILQGLGHPPDRYLDIDPRKIGRVYDGAQVLHLDALPLTPRPFVLSYVANHGAWERVQQCLTGKGLRLGVDFLPVG